MNSEANSSIVLVRFSATDIDLKLEDLSTDNLDGKTATAIYNAWVSSAIIDTYGTVWICNSKLHVILRTTSAIARYHLATIDDEYKRQLDGKTYIRGTEICRIIDNIIQAAGSMKREKYASFSESLYKEIRDSDEAKLVRAEFYEHAQAYKKVLKKARIQCLALERDELTNAQLQKTSEFSHIRSAAVYPHLADKVWNGLVVNKKTHEVITKNNIVNETQLYDLCLDNGWNTNWRSSFRDNVYY